LLASTDWILDGASTDWLLDALSTFIVDLLFVDNFEIAEVSKDDMDCWKKKNRNKITKPFK
jgi:hypothetical protein